MLAGDGASYCLSLICFPLGGGVSYDIPTHATADTVDIEAGAGDAPLLPAIGVRDAAAA